ncbi:MAG: M48 family metalloprotease [Clostridia bacterium]|nr:M48 family metalloprotease [Clostridia bacterium]
MLFVPGVNLHRALPENDVRLIAAAICCTVRLCGLLVFETVMFNALKKKMRSVSVADSNMEMDEKKIGMRHASEQGDINLAAKDLKRAILNARIASFLMILSACGTVFFSPAFLRLSWLVTVCVIAGTAVFYAVFYRLYFMLLQKPDFSDYTKEEDYPELHALARKAAETVGVRGSIRIAITGGEADAAIAEIGYGRKKTYSLLLSTGLIGILTRDELFSVMLHEFSHVAAEAVKLPTSNFFCSFLLFDNPLPDSKYDMLFVLGFKYSIASCLTEKEKFGFLSGEFIEKMTDEAAAARGDASVFASALVKISLYSKFSLIMDDYIEEDKLFFKNEECPTDWFAYLNSRFGAALAENSEKWLHQFAVEIQPKNATHPIVRDRLASIGQSLDGIALTLPDLTSDSPFTAECVKAIESTGLKLTESTRDQWTENRKALYLEPSETVENFENKGSVCPPEEYRSVVEAYVKLNRLDKAAAFCRRLADAASIDDNSKAYPLMWLGEYYLTRDDPAGLPLVYRAVDANTNAVSAAIDALGSYCTRNGLHDEYAKYRENAMVWMQHQIDVDSERSVLNERDNLSAETFTDEELKSHIDTILGVSDGLLNRIYLVHKKINDTESGYASIFVIEFIKDSSDEEREKVYEKIFNFLDTVPTGHEYALLILNPQYEKILNKISGTLVYKKS